MTDQAPFTEGSLGLTTGGVVGAGGDDDASCNVVDDGSGGGDGGGSGGGAAGGVVLGGAQSLGLSSQGVAAADTDDCIQNKNKGETDLQAPFTEGSLGLTTGGVVGAGGDGDACCKCWLCA